MFGIDERPEVAFQVNTFTHQTQPGQFVFRRNFFRRRPALLLIGTAGFQPLTHGVEVEFVAAPASAEFDDRDRRVALQPEPERVVRRFAETASREGGPQVGPAQDGWLCPFSPHIP